MSAVPGFPWLYTPAWQPLVHALLHTLWQGALAVGGLFLALRWTPAHRANLRYGLSTAALALVLLLGLSSWALLDTPRPSAASTLRAGSPSAAAAASASGPLPARTPASTLPILSGERTTARATGVNPYATNAEGDRAEPWVYRVAGCWLLGVGVSLLRAARGAFGAERLRRRCRALADPRILALAEELRGRLGLSRRVRLLVSEEVGVPSVLGVLWPAVLLPAAMLTGVPMEQLRAILAHELAHVRRWDYLVNLAQMLIEALLFFNPFVWWISRQMRVEREACCDQLAAGECQSPASYVEALVSVIERSRSAAEPILAASGPAPHGGAALDRTRRLLVPGYQPALRLRWFSLVTVLTLSGLALSGWWLGTRSVAQTIERTEQRTEPKPMDDQSTGTRTSAAYHIKVVMADGSPLDGGEVVIHNHDQFASSGSWGDFRARPDGSATVNVQANTLTFTVAATKAGYAAVFAAPFTPQNMDKLDVLKLKLSRGYAAVIETVDEAGQPVAGASLTGVYPGPPEIKFGGVKTDAAGAATFEHLGEAPLTVHVLADGYQADEIKSVHLDAAKPYRWTLKKTSPVHGRITASSTGQPIAGAVVRLAYVRGRANENYLWPGSGPVLATTDEQGRFTLGSLRPDSRYWLDVDAPGHGGVFLGVVTSAHPELNVELGPKLMIRGKLINVPPALLHKGKIVLGYSQTFSLDNGNAGIANDGVELTPVNGEAAFEIGPFYKASGQDAEWNGTLEYARNTITLGVSPLSAITYGSADLPSSDVVLNLAEKAADAPAISPGVGSTENARPTITDRTLNQMMQAMQDNAEKTPANSSGLKILQGFFGADGSWRDVTKMLQDSVSQDALQILWPQPYSVIGGDPAFGKIKTLVVTYQIDGKTRIATFQEEGSIPELKATIRRSAQPNEGGGATPTPPASLAPVTPALPYKLSVTPEIERAFANGEGIEIRAITGTASHFQTGETYHVTGVCRQQTLAHATLYVGNTAEPGSAAIVPAAGSSLYTALPKGSTEFDCTFRLLRPGVLHATIYDLDHHDKDDNAYAGVDLGKVAPAEDVPPFTLASTVDALPASTPPPRNAWPPRPADWPARPFEICRVFDEPQPNTQPEVKRIGPQGEKTTSYVEKQAMLDERAVQSVSVRNEGGRRSIVIVFTPEAARQFAEFTRQNVGQRIEIFCDGWPLLSPTITQTFPSSELVLQSQFVPWLEHMIVSINAKPTADLPR